MYFGDHPYADLADVTLHHGWHTGAVIRELEVSFFEEFALKQDRSYSITLLAFSNSPSVILHFKAEIITMNTDEFKWGVNWQQVSLTKKV